MYKHWKTGLIVWWDWINSAWPKCGRQEPDYRQHPNRKKKKVKIIWCALWQTRKHEPDRLKRVNGGTLNPKSNYYILSCTVMSCGLFSHRAFHMVIERKTTLKSLLLRRCRGTWWEGEWHTGTSSCVYFSRQTAQVILIPRRATLIHPQTLWAPTALKNCPFKTCCPSYCAVHPFDLDEAPQFQDERLPLQKQKKKVQMF